MIKNIPNSNLPNFQWWNIFLTLTLEVIKISVTSHTLTKMCIVLILAGLRSWNCENLQNQPSQINSTSRQCRKLRWKERGQFDWSIFLFIWQLSPFPLLIHQYLTPEAQTNLILKLGASSCIIGHHQINGTGHQHQKRSWKERDNMTDLLCNTSKSRKNASLNLSDDNEDEPKKMKTMNRQSTLFLKQFQWARSKRLNLCPPSLLESTCY